MPGVTGSIPPLIGFVYLVELVKIFQKANFIISERFARLLSFYSNAVSLSFNISSESGINY